MLSNESYEGTYPDNYENNFDEQLEQKITISDVCIPKVEPCYLDTSRSDEDTLDTNESLASPIPFIVPYKIKDPSVVLERCDKIWETLQLIKDAQNKSNVNSLNELPAKKTNSTSYIAYKPVLSNDNAALPDFAFSVKAKKKLHQCSVCCKLYTKHLTLRLHADRVHNIHIDPKRSRHSSVHGKSVDKEKDKERERKKGREEELEGEFNVNEKEKKDYEQVYSKRNENIFTDASSQSSSSSTDHSISNHRKPKIKSNVLLHSGNSINVNEILQKKQGKRTSNTDLQPNEKQIFLHQDPTVLTCILCMQQVKDIKKHLTDYHKIESSDFMVKELQKISPKSKFEELNNKRAVNNGVLKESETVQKHSRVQERVKRKSSGSPTDSRKKYKVDNNNTLKVQFPLRTNGRKRCDVCLRMFEKFSYPTHRNDHRLRGETRENFLLYKGKLSKSSSRSRQKKNSNSNDVPTQNTNNSEYKDKHSSSSSNRKEVTGQMFQNWSKDKKACSTSNIGNHTVSCSCGKLFHNSYTLSKHKKCCTFKSKISTAENNLNESVPTDKQNACDKDLSPGISITIKKKNNSYEIVDRDGENENELEDSNRLKRTEISDISRNNGQVNSRVQLKDLELFKYSKHHSILKIEPVEEDIYIDIINELQAKSCNNNISKTNKSVKDLRKKETIQRIVQNQETNSKRIHKKDLQSKERNINKLNIPQKYFCVCGIKLYNKKAFDVHIDKHQTNLRLKCGYCKTDFADINAWNKHGCSVKQYKQFFDVPIPLICYCCNITVETQKQLDEHTELKHSNHGMQYQCYKCNKCFQSNRARKLHYAAEHSMIICPICQAKIQNANHTKSKHEGYHYGLGYPCHLCKKAYSSKERLMKHNITIHCKIPNEISNTSGSLFMNQPLRAKDKLCSKSLTHLNKNIELES